MITKASRYVWNCCFFVILCYGVIFNVLYRPSHPIFYTFSEPYFYKLNPFYAPSRIERYALEHSVALNYHLTVPVDPTSDQKSPPRGCEMWEPSPLLISEYLQVFRQEMALYNQLLQSHPGVDGDVRERLNSSCSDLHIHPHGLGGVFTNGSLSRSSTALLEPFYPPFASLLQKCSRWFWWRSHDQLDFLVHDFPSICHGLKPTSNIILVDVGYDVASKWTNGKRQDSTTSSLLRLFKKFGFPVDAIYVFDTISSDFTIQQPWISHIYQVSNWDSRSRSIQEYPLKDTQSERQNHPWDWIGNNFDIDDLILVTLHLPPRDVDPTREIQLLEEIPSSPIAQKIDALYFHPRVYMAEDELPRKKKSNDESNEIFRWAVRDALRFYTRLREKGIHAHAFVS